MSYEEFMQLPTFLYFSFYISISWISLYVLVLFPLRSHVHFALSPLFYHHLKMYYYQTDTLLLFYHYKMITSYLCYYIVLRICMDGVVLIKFDWCLVWYNFEYPIIIVANCTMRRGLSLWHVFPLRNIKPAWSLCALKYSHWQIVKTKAVLQWMIILPWEEIFIISC